MKRCVPVPIEAINRPHESLIDEGKVVDLMKSISEIGLLEPVDLIEFEGKLYGSMVAIDTQHISVWAGQRLRRISAMLTGLRSVFI